MRQAEDFRAVSADVERLVGSLDEADYARATFFKGWTIDQILRHLHVWNQAAYWQLADEARLKGFLGEIMGAMSGGGGLPAFEEKYLGGLSGKTLFDEWRGFYQQVADAFAKADPAQRLLWAGPTMSARSSITARLMETWSHAQAIYDELDLDREETDAIENIVVLGLNTYGFCFKNRGLEPPEPRPQLLLTAPSGAQWRHGEEAGEERIEGLASEFCQVVAQTRNIADTDLKVSGPNAEKWMSIAQCFAGPPNDPPAPGTRRKKSA